jgi:hypothetical protein
MLVSCSDGGGCAIDHGFGANVITVIFVHDEDVLVARYTRDKKFPGGVGVYHAGGTVTVVINYSCTGVVLCRRRHVVFEISIRGWLLHV